MEDTEESVAYDQLVELADNRRMVAFGQLSGRWYVDVNADDEFWGYTLAEAVNYAWSYLGGDRSQKVLDHHVSL